MSWLVYGIASGILAAIMLSVFTKKFVTVSEVMLIVFLTILGPVGLVMVLFALFVVTVLKLESAQHKILFDWSPSVKSAECPRCAYFSNKVPLSCKRCPNCDEELLGK